MPIRVSTRGWPLKARFERMLDRRDPNECWPWLGYTDKDGYGTIAPTHGTLKKAHRVAYEMMIGPIPDAMGVLHTCDNPSCCNPLHLFIGTQADNDRDRDQKGRTQRGERHGNAKLTADAVRQIRTLRADGASQQGIADRFGVHQTAISSVLSGRTWGHV
jgi:hypothetical protein